MFKQKLLFVLMFFSVIANAQKVTLDYYYNHEVHIAKDGTVQRFHYLWTDTANSGFSIWGNYFKAKGAVPDTLGEAPNTQNLKGTDIYIIVDPDTRKESQSPNYITKQDAGQIAAWVHNGGVLVMMANDSANVELPHFNILAGEFGMHFNNDLQNHVTDDVHFEDGTVKIINNKVFKTAKKVFLKDVCSIAIPGNAMPVLKATNGAVIAATLKYGKGAVFAVGDPWFYNEYMNGRLPRGYDNEKAAIELTNWLRGQVPIK